MSKCFVSIQDLWVKFNLQIFFIGIKVNLSFYRMLPSFGGISTEMVEETQTPSMPAVLYSLETNGVRNLLYLNLLIKGLFIITNHFSNLGS